MQVFSVGVGFCQGLVLGEYWSVVEGNEGAGTCPFIFRFREVYSLRPAWDRRFSDQVCPNASLVPGIKARIRARPLTTMDGSMAWIGVPPMRAITSKIR